MEVMYYHVLRCDTWATCVPDWHSTCVESASPVVKNPISDCILLCGMDWIGRVTPGGGWWHVLNLILSGECDELWSVLMKQITLFSPSIFLQASFNVSSREEKRGFRRGRPASQGDLFSLCCWSITWLRTSRFSRAPLRAICHVRTIMKKAKTAIKARLTLKTRPFMAEQKCWIVWTALGKNITGGLTSLWLTLLICAKRHLKHLPWVYCWTLK